MSAELPVTCRRCDELICSGAEAQVRYVERVCNDCALELDVEAAEAAEQYKHLDWQDL